MAHVRQGFQFFAGYPQVDRINVSRFRQLRRAHDVVVRQGAVGPNFCAAGELKFRVLPKIPRDGLMAAGGEGDRGRDESAPF